jgi:hypothetical protein
MLADRAKAEDCLKCGKKGYSWTTCWNEEPVTIRVPATMKRKRALGAIEPSADSVVDSKKGKTAGVATVHVPIAPKVESRGSLFEIAKDRYANSCD